MFDAKDIEFFSTGSCPGCEDCGLSAEPTEHEIDIASEPYFTWSSCEICNSGLGGSRYPAHGVIDGAINHFNICEDCLMQANGYEVPYV